MWTSNIKIWIKTETEWREAIAFIKDATGWKPTIGFIRTGGYEQVPIVSLSGLTSLSSARGLNEVPIVSLSGLTALSSVRGLNEVSILSLESSKSINITFPPFREVSIFSLPQGISVTTNDKTW